MPTAVPCPPHPSPQDLSFCGLPALPEELTALSSVLTHLDVSHNDLHCTDNLHSVLTALPQLRYLSLELSGGMLGPDVGADLALRCTQLTYLNVEPLRRLAMGPRFAPWGTPWKQLLEAVAQRCAASPPGAREAPPEQPPGLEEVQGEASQQDALMIAEMVAAHRGQQPLGGGW